MDLLTIKEVKKQKDLLVTLINKLDPIDLETIDVVNDVKKTWNNLVYAIDQLVLKSGIGKNKKFIKPMTGRISGKYREERFNSKGQKYYHTGIDLADNPVNKTQIFAVADGIITRCCYYGGYGNCVDIDHGSGMISRYAHFSTMLTEKDRIVKQGDLLGIVGSTGHSTGPHLHFEIRINDKCVDPNLYIDFN